MNSKVRFLIPGLLLSLVLTAADKKSPQGMVEDDTVAISATILNSFQTIQAVGSDFDNDMTVLEVHITPKGNKPYDLKLSDFILRNEQSGEHSGPFDSPEEIAGQGALQVQRVYGNRSNVDSPRPLEGTKLTMKDGDKSNPALANLKQKMLTDHTITEPVTGLMFFPLSKVKPKNLILSCQTPQGHLRMSFK
jgi:hypothetical protein